METRSTKKVTLDGLDLADDSAYMDCVIRSPWLCVLQSLFLISFSRTLFPDKLGHGNM
jgi:hypothetical protein